MEKVHKVLTMIFVSIKISVHTFIFPGYKSWTMAMFAGILTLLALLAKAVGWLNFVDWRGAAIATVILSLLHFVGRKDDDQHDGAEDDDE